MFSYVPDVVHLAPLNQLYFYSIRSLSDWIKMTVSKWEHYIK